MTNSNEYNALGYLAEKEEQRLGAHPDGPAVIAALDMAVRRACCLETLAASVLDDMDKGLAGYRLAELLALDVSALAMELEAMRDDLGDVLHGTPNRFSARD